MRLTYSELSRLKTLDERFKYLQIGGLVGADTFGGHRVLNQDFYRSPEWKRLRREIILRDNGYELGLEPYEIKGAIYIHHINPITVDDLLSRSADVFDPENLISVSFAMHQAIHYGDGKLLDIYKNVGRSPNDMCPWKR